MQSGIFSLYPESATQKKNPLARFITRYQGYLIWPIITLQGFSLKFDSIQTLRNNPKGTRVDQVILALHFLLWFGLPVYMLGWADATINYLLMTWFIGPYLGSVFLVNHIGTHVAHSGDKMPAFIQRLITTRNLGGSRLEDIYFGGMNNHIEHHLFSRIPISRLPKARDIMQAFCIERGYAYQQAHIGDTVRDNIRYFRGSSPAKVIAE